MNKKLLEFNQSLKKKEVPTLKSGDVVRIHRRIKEGDKERIQIFKGLVIAVKGGQSSSPTVTVRRESDGIGTEMIFPLQLPVIEKIEILRHSKVRRSKLYYMRGRTGRAAKMKTQDLTKEEKTALAEIGAIKKEDQPSAEKLEPAEVEKK